MLFCPKCGDPLETTESGELICKRGQMSLILRLQQQFIECYVEGKRRPRDVVFAYGGKPHPIGGRWFCPGCGHEIQETSPGDLTCPQCGKSIVEFIYWLVERHPHA